MVLGLVILAAGMPAMALAAVPPQPTYGSAIVDGAHGEWVLSEDSAGDFFANMYRAADPTKTLESKLYLRYSCANNTMYALVLTQPGVTLDTTKDQFIKVPGNNKVVDKAFASFAYVMSGSSAVGWEASGVLVPPSNPYTYANLNAHAQVLDGGSNTSAVENRSINLTIECQPSAVTLSGLSARPTGSFPLASAAVLAVGMVGAGVFALRRRQ
jgi:hypothetical protein